MNLDLPKPLLLGIDFVELPGWTFWQMDTETGLVRVVQRGMDGDWRREAWMPWFGMDRLLRPSLWDRWMACLHRRRHPWPRTGYYIPYRWMGAFFLKESVRCPCGQPGCACYILCSYNKTLITGHRAHDQSL